MSFLVLLFVITWLVWGYIAAAVLAIWAIDKTKGIERTNWKTAEKLAMLVVVLFGLILAPAIFLRCSKGLFERKPLWNWPTHDPYTLII